ncbi:MAG: hypothetical protein Tsb002_35870 [Wenzhouxiangellaceae bacterium]
MTLSATSLINNSVKNPQGEDLGDVKDLMVDPATGIVNYAVVSFGGFLGFGDKLFAIPLQTMTLNTEDKHFILSESKERLKNAPGFDKDNWPDHADGRWLSTVNQYYNIAA